MAKQFSIPRDYRSDFISGIKRKRTVADNLKKDLSPTVLDLKNVKIKLARFFGFCYGVENAIEIAYRALEENQDKRIFLLSEMIHNPQVNQDLRSRGVQFLYTTLGEPLIPIETLTPEDIVIIPAFGTTLEMFAKLEQIGVEALRYNATCPFVEKVWKRGADLGAKGFTIVIHGQPRHEETRATFSHVHATGPSVVVKNTDETTRLCSYIKGELPLSEFKNEFAGRFSPEFDPEKDLSKIGVVNQTTMLAEETRGISQMVRDALCVRYGEESISQHFADTRDTLCYATSENQRAMRMMVESGADLAIVVGGYNSSNTSHLVEICEEVMPVFYIKDALEILDNKSIRHFDLHKKEVVVSKDWIPEVVARVPEIVVSAGASCPDNIVEEVIRRLASLFEAEFKADLGLVA